MRSDTEKRRELIKGTILYVGNRSRRIHCMQSDMISQCSVNAYGQWSFKIISPNIIVAY